MKTTPVKMLLVGMGIMALAIKPQIGLAIVNGFVAGVQEVAIAINDKPPPEVESEELVYTENGNDATALILDQILTELRNSRSVDSRNIITETQDINSKPLHISRKYDTTNELPLYEQQYRRLQEQEQIAENKVNYHGTDPVIRNRLNLAPKVPSFEKWNPSVDTFDRVFEARFGSR